MEHCEHHTSGVINDGEVSRKLGVEGVPSSTEMAIVSRDIEAARTSGAHIHLQHVSTSEAFDAVRRAKAEGISVTCETAPHYFALSDQAVEKYGSLAKMNPPLRSEADRQATLEAIADGTVDVIATDHAPHTVSEKSSGLLESPNGIIGLETSYALANSYLVESGLISHDRLIELMSLNPADLEGMQRVNIDQLLDVHNTAAAHEESSDLAAPHRVLDVRGMAVDSDTDDADDEVVAPRINLSLLAPHAEWTVEPEAFLSKARNTPFGGQTLTGRAVATIVNATLFDVAGTLKGESWID
jgi:dihydroorotase